MTHAPPAAALKFQEASAPSPIDVATLQSANSASLEARFAAARWQGAIDLVGHPAGHMLAVPGLDYPPFSNLLRAFGGRLLNPWQGKSFGKRDGQGIGTNRLRLLGARFTRFRFKTYETTSVVDGAPAFAIDYDTQDTPAYARATYDELRPVARGLFLGRGMTRLKNAPPKLLVWFALDLNRPDSDVVI